MTHTGSIGVCLSLGLLCSGIGVSLLDFVLLDTLAYGGTASINNHLDTCRSVIVGRDNIVDVGRIAVGINDTEHGDTET